MLCYSSSSFSGALSPSSDVLPHAFPLFAPSSTGRRNHLPAPWQRRHTHRHRHRPRPRHIHIMGMAAASKPLTTTQMQVDFLRYTPSPTPTTGDTTAGGGGEGEGGELQVSIVRYSKVFPWRLLNPNLQVHLVSAVHIADKQYFDILQHRLSSYDCVLYEGVTDSHPPDKDSPSSNITAFLQRLMARLLSMHFQLDCLNYKSPRWYNADLDWDTFQRLQEERGESFFSTATNALSSAFKSDEDDTTTAQLGLIDSLRSKFLRVSWLLPMPLAFSLLLNLTCSPRTPNDDKDDFGNLVREFLDLGLGSGLKVLLARSLTSMYASEIYADLEEDSVIIGERNKAALEELKKAISRGEKKIAIFYGAGHMPDFGRRLREDFDMVPTDADWVTAWSIRKGKSKLSGPFFQKYIGRFLPFSNETGRMLVVGSVSCSILVMDLWLWWSAFTVAYQSGFQAFRLVQSLVIM